MPAKPLAYPDPPRIRHSVMELGRIFLEATSACHSNRLCTSRCDTGNLPSFHYYPGLHLFPVRRRIMDCPKCGGYLETKVYGPKISLERCRECFGLLVAPDVLMEMREEWMTEAFLDIGHPKVGRQYDKVGDIRCPACLVPMDKIIDPVQTHIWLEACPQCEKIFLDAGEFSDLKYETFMDKIKDLFRGKRPQ